MILHNRRTTKFDFDRPAARVRRKPMRASRELAEEFGIATNALTRLMNADPNGPRPQLDLKGSVPGKWYDPAEVRAWWAKRQEAAK